MFLAFILQNTIVKEEEKMRIAVPLFKNRISPHFCTSVEVLLVDIEKKKIIEERKTYWEELNPSERIGKLKQWGVNVLLCGGITSYNKRKIQSFDIEVVSELRGQAKEVLKQWLNQYPAESFLQRNCAKNLFQNNMH